MKIAQLKELVKQVVKEEHEYQQLFKHILDKSGKDIPSMSDDDKKKFFNAVDTAYKAKSEGRLRGYNEAELTAGQKKIDTDGDGEIEGSDLADLRAGKKVSELVVNEDNTAYETLMLIRNLEQTNKLLANDLKTSKGLPNDKKENIKKSIVINQGLINYYKETYKNLKNNKSLVNKK